MLHPEVSDVLVPPVRYEDGGVIDPSVSGGSAKENPMIALRNLEEKPDPGSVTNQTLLVEDEERTVMVHVSSNVVP
jgi:hypothetical protein